MHLYQQFNDSGPLSSLSPWIVVMLARGLGDGTANFNGLAPDAVTYLGNGYLDLHGFPQSWLPPSQLSKVLSAVHFAPVSACFS